MKILNFFLVLLLGIIVEAGEWLGKFVSKVFKLDTFLGRPFVVVRQPVFVGPRRVVIRPGPVFVQPAPVFVAPVVPIGPVPFYPYGK